MSELAVKRQIINDLRKVAQAVQDGCYGSGGLADEIRAIANRIIGAWEIGDGEE